MTTDRKQLVLFPGLDGTGLLFKRFVAALSPRIEAKVVTHAAGAKTSLPELARQAARQLPPGKSIVLAESFSGLVALSLPPSALAQVGGIVFVGAFAEPPRPFLLRLAPLAALAPALLQKAPAFLLRQYCLGRDATVEDLTALRQALATVDPGVLAHRLDLVAARHAFEKTIHDIPCCYVRAKDDHLVPASAEKWFARHFRRYAMEEIDGPHFLLQARPAEAARVIERLLDQYFV